MYICTPACAHLDQGLWWHQEAHPDLLPDGIRSRPGARQGLGPIVFLPTTKQIESALNSPTSIYRLYTQFPFCLVTITCVNSKRSEEACVEEVQYFS